MLVDVKQLHITQMSSLDIAGKSDECDMAALVGSSLVASLPIGRICSLWALALTDKNKKVCIESENIQVGHAKFER